MLVAARRLTWIEGVEPLRDPGKTIVRWLNDVIDSNPGTSGRRVALIGGDYMRRAFHRPFLESFDNENLWLDATPWLRTLMRCKSPRELAIIRESCATLDAATKALAQAKRAGAGVTASVLEAGRAAHYLGAQDVRTLFSIDRGRTLRPFEQAIDSTVDPLQAYVAVRHVGYWVEGFVSLAAAEHPVLIKAAEALKTVITSATAGTKCSDLARLTAEKIGPHPPAREPGHWRETSGMGSDSQKKRNRRFRRPAKRHWEQAKSIHCASEPPMVKNIMA